MKRPESKQHRSRNDADNARHRCLHACPVALPTMGRGWGLGARIEHEAVACTRTGHPSNDGPMKLRGGIACAAAERSPSIGAN